MYIRLIAQAPHLLASLSFWMFEFPSKFVFWNFNRQLQAFRTTKCLFLEAKKGERKEAVDSYSRFPMRFLGSQINWTYFLRNLIAQPPFFRLFLFIFLNLFLFEPDWATSSFFFLAFSFEYSSFHQKDLLTLSLFLFYECSNFLNFFFQKCNL